LHRRRGHDPILLGVEALKRKGGIMVVQGELRIPELPARESDHQWITIKSARGHSYRSCKLALAQLASDRFRSTS